MQEKFLEQLANVLPEGCRPILVTDGGFKNPWFRAVARRGWDWIGRIRGRTMVTRNGEDVWLTCTARGRLLKRNKKVHFGEFLLAQTNPLLSMIYGLRKPPKGRVDKTEWKRQRVRKG